MSLLTSLFPSRTSAPVKTEDVSATASRAAAIPDHEPTVRPRYQITESADSFTLVVELPGVTKPGLELSLDRTHFRVVGRRAWQRPETWTALHRELRDAAFELTLDHAHAVDPEKVRAELRDGLLQVLLPKAEALKPRKITVA